MRLDGEQFKQFHQALLDAFPDVKKLKMMVRMELKEKLEEIAGGDNLSEVVFNLIDSEETRGRTQELVKGAWRANPTNAKLRNFVEHHLIDAEWLKDTASSGSFAWKLCDRGLSTFQFVEHFEACLNDCSCVPQIYIVYGEEGASHSSFIERLVYTKLQVIAEQRWGKQRGVLAFKKLDWEYGEENELAFLQKKLQRDLFEQVAGIYSTDDWSLKGLFEQPAVQIKPVIALQYTLYASQWNRCTARLLDWYLDYWTAIDYPREGPLFIVFLAIVYPGEKRRPTWKAWLPTRRTEENKLDADENELETEESKFEKELNALRESHANYFPCPSSHFHVLKKLDCVTPVDVQQWCVIHTNLSEAICQDIIQKLFMDDSGHTVPCRSMAFIEAHLETLIEGLRRQKIDDFFQGEA